MKTNKRKSEKLIKSENYYFLYINGRSKIIVLQKKKHLKLID